jgi:PREDICTED: similar to no mitochondrial derivative CG5395-PA
MGATNRVSDVDPAILRRMPAMYKIGLPNLEMRKQILRLILERETLNTNVDLYYIVQATEGFSGSDLRELCRGAAMRRVRELSSRLSNLENLSSYSLTSHLRSIQMEDFILCLNKIKESKNLITSRLIHSGHD